MKLTKHYFLIIGLLFGPFQYLCSQQSIVRFSLQGSAGGFGVEVVTVASLAARSLLYPVAQDRSVWRFPVEISAVQKQAH